MSARVYPAPVFTNTTLQDDLASLRALFPPGAKLTTIGTVIADHAIDSVQPLVNRGWIALYTSTWVSGGRIAQLTREGKRVLAKGMGR